VDKALDKEFGGVYWMLDSEGNVKDTQKHIYNQGFAIYAFSEYYLASGDKNALRFAQELFGLIEEYAFDQEFGGYLEAFDREWNTIPNHLVCDTSEGVLAEKSMNTHLHIMEAYTRLHSAEPNAQVQAQLKGLVALTRDHIVDEKLHYGLFFTRDWKCVSSDVSYGHDIEGTWLMDEAAGQLVNSELAADIFALTTKMAQVTLKQGLDRDGAVFNELREGYLLDSDRIWWVQAEAMIGFFNAYQKEPNTEFFEAAKNCWQIIQSHLVDQENGEWHWKTNRQGQPCIQKPKVEPWKCPYHNGRACMEIYARIAPLESTEQPSNQS
jgi:mannobiose 2-epimerase